MTAKTLAVTAVLLVSIAVGSTVSQAQSDPGAGWRFKEHPHKIEITPYGGYSWTGAIDAVVDDEYGSLDIKSSGIWGVELDVNVRPGGQLTVLYHRQDSELTFRPTSSQLKNTLSDISVEYFQFGGIGGVYTGRVMPFTMFTLGATRLTPKSPLTSDIWKFSMVLGFGAKVYMGDRIGIRVHVRIPWVIIDGGGAVACGAGGCYVAMSGSGFVQPDIGAGLMLLF